MRQGRVGAPGYGAVSKSLHWLIMLLLVVQYALGWTMPDVGKNTLPAGLIFWHVSVGMLLLAVMLFRFVWRVARPVPLLGGVPMWQHWTARVTHVLLYAAVFVQLCWAGPMPRAGRGRSTSSPSCQCPGSCQRPRPPAWRPVISITISRSSYWGSSGSMSWRRFITTSCCATAYYGECCSALSLRRRHVGRFVAAEHSDRIGNQ